jgi:hypothetical protein
LAVKELAFKRRAPGGAFETAPRISRFWDLHFNDHRVLA